MKVKSVFVLLLTFTICSSFVPPTYQLARLKYSGGGDWYGNRTALRNLANFCNKNIHTNFNTEEAIAEVGSPEIFNYPLLYLTGHGNITLSPHEATNLRNYLIGGGFVHIDDNYGLDKSIRIQMKKVFPELSFTELPPGHALYRQSFRFPNGLPKIHEHDGKRPQGLALVFKGRMVCYYSYESDLGNGWEDEGTYPSDTPEKQLEALKMGANIVEFVFTQ